MNKIAGLIDLKRIMFIFPVLIFSITWIYVLVVQMETFQIGIFDYGVAYNLVWREAHSMASLPSEVGYLPYFESTKLISFILVPYFLIFPSVYNLLVMQVLVFVLTSVVLYFFSIRLTKKVGISLMVEIIWLLYYPNSAAISYPFHFMTFFPLFYTMGFLFLEMRQKSLSLLSFFLASITSLIAPIILIFTIPILHFRYQKIMTQQNEKNKTEPIIFILVILLISAFVLILNYILGGLTLFKGEVIPTTSSSYSTPLLVSLYDKFVNISGFPGFLYILFMTFPLLFSIFLEWRFSFAALPSMLYYLVGYSGGFLRYFYPMQYSVLISPIIFISFVYFIMTIQNGEKRRWILHKNVIRRIAKRYKAKGSNIVCALLVSSFIMNAGLFAVYSPIGPLNQFLKLSPNANPPSNGGYGIYGNLSTSSYDLSLLKMESLVPTNATVLSQFNMPQFSDRYYFTYPGQYNPSYPIDYAINDPANMYFFTTAVRDTGLKFYNFNMLSLSNMFLQNSSYGIYGQSMGALLFKLNYSGAPLFYAPLNFNLSFQKNNYEGTVNNLLLYPGTFKVKLTQYTGTNMTLYLGATKVFTFNQTDLNTSLFVPFYSIDSLRMVGAFHNATISFLQVKPATDVEEFPVLPSPVIFHNFSANNSHFRPVVANLINFNNSTFSYVMEINLTTFEYGGTTPIIAPNDAQVFSIEGSFSYIWVQIENTGYLEYGFRNQNASMSNYIEPIKIPTNRWFFIEATYSHGSVSLYVNGLLVYSGIIFPSDSGVGKPQMLEIGGGHPFIVYGKTIPNSNPLNASIANFVIYNKIMLYNEMENPTLMFENLGNNTAVVYSNWVNA